jgi:hypothetical protein
MTDTSFFAEYTTFAMNEFQNNSFKGGYLTKLLFAQLNLAFLLAIVSLTCTLNDE